MRLIEIWVSHWFIWFSHTWEVVFVFALTFKLPQTIPIEKQGMCVLLVVEFKHWNHEIMDGSSWWVMV